MLLCLRLGAAPRSGLVKGLLDREAGSHYGELFPGETRKGKTYACGLTAGEWLPARALCHPLPCPDLAAGKQAAPGPKDTAPEGGDNESLIKQHGEAHRFQRK